MESSFTKNKLLLIAPVFFDYYKEIMCEAQNMGLETSFICDAPSNSNISKAIGRINKSLLRNNTEKYFRLKVLPTLQNTRYNYVLVVAGMTFSFTRDMVKEIRKFNPDAKFILYQWDSEKNLPYVSSIHQYFDSVYSFDRIDCTSRDIYHFLPLFYTRAYETIGKDVLTTFEYDCMYVGTAHPLKYKNINKMAISLKRRLPRQFIYHYMPSKLKYYYHKLSAPEYKEAKLSDFHMEKVSKDELLSLIRKSRCILDAPQAGQTGLTIRSIECLGAKRKLITSNPEIRKYDFYSKNNILVFEDGQELNEAFFTSPYEEIDENIYSKYSLRSWLRTMLDE